MKDNNSTIVPLLMMACFEGSSVGMTVACVSLSLYVMVGTPAYCWLFWVSLHPDWKIKPTQVFLLNLIILELIFGIIAAIQVLNVVTSLNLILWRMSSVVFGITWAGRPLMQICICVEQYLAVIHPVMFLKYKGLQHRIVFAAVVWLMAAGYGVYEAYAITFPDPIFNSIFFLATTVILFCCVSVLRALKHPGPGDTQIPMERRRDVGNLQKRKAFNVIFSRLLIIVFTYLPQVSLTLFYVIPIDELLFRCDIVPIMTSFTVGVMITPLLKMYKHGHKKCLKLNEEFTEVIVDSLTWILQHVS